MAVTLDFDGSIEKITGKLDTMKGQLEGIAVSYDEIGQASNKAIGVAVADQNKNTTATKKANVEIKKQQELVFSLEKEVKRLETLQASTGDPEKIEEYNKALAETKKRLEEANAATKKTNKEQQNQVGIVQKLQAHLKRLEVGQKKALGSGNLANVKKYNAEIAKTRAALVSVSGAGGAAAKGIGAASTAGSASIGIFKSLRGVLATTFAPLLAVGAATQAISGVVSLVTEYEQVGADLQAITGANAETLEFLKQEAVEVGVETTVSATKTLEAYKLIASAKPELLSNAEGLAEITREAVRLTETFGGDLPTVATNLTDIMNKFQAPASEAARFVNVLAAGSKEGSAPIDSLAASFLNAGTVLNAQNVKFEEGVGIFEALAENGLKFSEAGTAVRNVVSKLSATDVLPPEAVKRLQAAGVNMEALSDKSLSFRERLEALKPIQNDANALVSVFGLENQSAAQILINSTDRIDELTKAVTDTNVAQEQASIRTATARGEWQKLINTIQATVQESGNGLGSFIALLIRVVREGVLFLRDAINELRPTFSSLIDTVGGLFNAIGKLLPAQKEAGEGTSAWSKAVKFATAGIKTFFTLIEAGIKIVTAIVNAFSKAAERSKFLAGVFNILKNSIIGTFNVFIDLPSYVSGAIAAVQTFVTETLSAFGTLGTNIKNVLKEAFNLKKIITEGTGDLENAVSDALVNPFKGIGSKAADAFTKEFNDSKKEVEVPVKLAPLNIQDGTGDTDTGTGTGGTSNFSRQGEEAKKQAEKEAKEQLKIQQDLEKAKLDALAEGAEKQLALENARYKDLEERLLKFNLSTEEALQQHELNKFNIRQNFLEKAADLEELKGEERIKFIFDETKKQIDALETSLKTSNEGVLSEDQTKQINLLRKKANEEYLTDLRQFQTKEQQEAENHEIALLENKREGFENQKDFETFKQEQILNIRLRYAEEQLKLVARLEGADSDAALALKKTINEIKGSIAEIEATGGAAKDFNLYSLFGLDPNDPKGKEIIQGIETAAQTAVDVLTQVNQMRLETVQSTIDAHDQEIKSIEEKINAKESELEKEISLQTEGFAANVQGVEDEIALLKEQRATEKKEREEAIKEKKKIQTQQAIIDSVTQATSLITAAANIFNSVSAIPFVGPALGAALVGAMIAAFVAARVKVFQSIQQQKAEKGMFAIADGKRHSHGGEKLGDHVEIEKGEAVGVLSRSATRRYSDVYETFVNAANKHDTKSMIEVAQRLAQGSNLDRDYPNKIASTEASIVQVSNSITAELNSKEIKENNRLLKQMLEHQKKPKEERFQGRGFTVVKKGNRTRIIKD